MRFRSTMRLETRRALYDALGFAEKIGELGQLDQLPLGVKELALERLISNLGEALGRVRKTEPVVYDKLPSAPALIAFRNALVHGYDQVDLRLTEEIIREDVPRILTEISAQLR